MEKPPAWDWKEREEENVDEPEREKVEDAEEVKEGPRERQTERQENN